MSQETVVCPPFEKKYDIQFKAVFDAIRELMTPLEPRKKRSIGFTANIEGDVK